MQELYNKKSIFIAGNGRSGTSLLRAILNKHSLISIIPETGFFDRLWASRHLMGRPNCPDQIVKWLYYVLFRSHDETMKPLREHLPNLIEICTRSTKISEFDLFLKILNYFAEFEGKVILGEKTPNHIYYMRTILNAYPNSKAIIMVRDPRGVISSALGRKDLRTSILELISNWKSSAREAIKLKDQFAKRVKLVKYEDLASKPADTINEICSFIKVDFEPGMQNPNYGNSSYFNNLTGIKDISISSWKNILEESDVSVIESLTKAELGILNYELPNSIKIQAPQLSRSLYSAKLKLELFAGHKGIRPTRAYLMNLRARYN